MNATTDHSSHPQDADRRDVKDALTAKPSVQTSRGRSARGEKAASRRRREPVENTDYGAFAARVIRAHARRVADGDVDGLADLPHLAAELDDATDVAVQGLRAFGYSWGEIASRLGTTRQAAQQRWGTK